MKEPVEAAAKEKEEKKKEKETKEVKETKEKVEKKGKEEGEKTTEKEKKEAEPNFEILQNPARVLRQQLKVIQLVEGSHYVPVKDIQIGGIVMVKHIQSDTEEELVEPVAGKSILFFFFFYFYFMVEFFWWNLVCNEDLTHLRCKDSYAKMQFKMPFTKRCFCNNNIYNSFFIFYFIMLY